MLKEFKSQIASLDEKYKLVKTINNKTLGITELVETDDGQLFIRKILPYVNDSYAILKDNPIDGIPKVYQAVEGINFKYIFGKNHNPILVTYVVEEFINGITLKQLLKDMHKFSEFQVHSFFAQLAQILINLHKHNIIHRDIKPDNIILMPDEKRVYLFDLGAARVDKGDEKSEDTVLIGTKGFAAPEQFGSGVSDARTDIYALGQAMKLLLGDEYNGYLKSILDLCIEFDPNRRLNSAERLLELLKNPQDKLLFLESKAASGDIKALVELGDAYKEGLIVPKNIAIAIEFYKKAAEKNDAEGLFKYGEYFECGITVKRNYEEAKKLYQRAAEQNFGLAFGKLGWFSYNGYGMPKDYNVAIYYFKKAATSEDERAFSLGKYGLARCALYGEGVPKDIEKGLKIINEIYENGSSIGAVALGDLYERGEFVEKDHKKAFSYYKEAAEKEHYNAFTTVGKCYYYGIGTEVDYAKAFYYLNKGLQINDSAAKAYLSIMYVYEDGVEQDCQKAYELCRESAEEGNNVACYFLANYFYKYGVIVAKNDRERFRWYKKAADGGYKPALEALGDCYKDGIGTTISINKAKECYEMGGIIEKIAAFE